MKDEDQSREQLLSELAAWRQRIAEMETAESQLRQAEETLKTLVLSLPLGICIVQEGRFPLE